MGQNKTLGMLGVLGGAVLKGTTTIVGKTAEKAGEIYDTVQEDRRKYSFIKEQNEENKRLMEKSTEAYRRTEIILHQEAEQLDHIRGQIIRDFKEIHTILSAEQHAAAQAERNIRDIDGLNMSTSLFAGVAGGGKAGIALADDAVGDLLRLQHVFGKSGDDVGRLVGGTVIDHQPFDLAAVFGRQAVGDRLQGSLHIVLHVVAGDNQGNQRFHTVSTGMFSCDWMW